MSNKIVIITCILLANNPLLQCSNLPWLLAQEQFNQHPSLSQVPQLRTLAADSALRHYELKTVQLRTPVTLHPFFDLLLKSQAAYVNTIFENSGPEACDAEKLYQSIPNFLLCEALEHARKPEILKPILAFGPNVNMFIGEHDCNNGNGPLHLMVQHEKYNYYLPRFINAGADLNIQTSLGYTPLIQATECKNIPAATLLVKARANIAVQDCLQQTVLHHAMYAADVTLVELLLHAKIDVYSQDVSGHTALDLITILIAFDDSPERPAREAIRKLLKKEMKKQAPEEPQNNCIML